MNERAPGSGRDERTGDRRVRGSHRYQCTDYSARWPPPRSQPVGGLLASRALTLQKGRPAISLQDRFPFATQLYRVQRVHRLALDRALESIGVTAPQFAVLVVLQQTHGLSNAELARNRNITPQTMNVILGRLEAAGLLVRKPHPEHGRILLAELTPTGESVVEQGLSRAAGVEACVSDALDSTERARLLQLLNRVADALTRASRL